MKTIFAVVFFAAFGIGFFTTGNETVNEQVKNETKQKTECPYLQKHGDMNPYEPHLRDKTSGDNEPVPVPADYEPAPFKFKVT